MDKTHLKDPFSAGQAFFLASHDLYTGVIDGRSFLRYFKQYERQMRDDYSRICFGREISRRSISFESLVNGRLNIGDDSWALEACLEFMKNIGGFWDIGEYVLKALEDGKTKPRDIAAYIKFMARP